MSQSDGLVARWNRRSYVESYLRVMADRPCDGREWARTLSATTESTVLDLGCGDARALIALSPFIRRGIGVDVSKHQIDHARKAVAAAGANNIELVHGDLRDFAIAAESIDVVMSIAALHHLADTEKARVLWLVHDALNPGGLFHLEDDTFNFAPEEFEQRAVEIRREWEDRFGAEAYERLKRELRFDDFEQTPYLTDLQGMIEAAGLVIEGLETHGLHGATVRARKPADGLRAR